MELTRRTWIKGGAAMAAALAATEHAAPIHADEGDPKPYPTVTAMAERVVLPERLVGPPPLPPLRVIALNRMAFGPRPDDWAAYDALGSDETARFAAYVTQQLNPAAIDDSACTARITAQGFTTLTKSLPQLWADHRVSDYSVRRRPFEEARSATWIRALFSRRQLFELLVDFWHNHFNVYGYHYDVLPVFTHYDRDVIRAHALGNFRTMLEAVATSTAMLYYLDNVYSSNAGPNENYARELFELHTLGAASYLGSLPQAQVPGFPANPSGYVDNDVYEAARAFTGWRVRNSSSDAAIGNTGEFFTHAPWHDRFQKTVLGRYLPNDRPALDDGRAVLDAVAAHPATARHLCTKLCRRFISDNPPQSVVDAAVATWTANSGAADQIKRVVQTILTSPEFAATWGEKVKRPFEVAAGALRAMQATWVPDNDFYWTYGQLGQRLFEWGPPNGYPDRHEAWTGTNVMLNRWNFVNAVVNGWVTGTTVDLRSQMPGSVVTPNAITDWWLQRIMGRSINAEDRARMVDFLAQGRNADYPLPTEQLTERLPHLVALILMCPDFQWR